MYSARFLLYRVTERFISPIYTICRLLQTPLFWVKKPCILLAFYYTESRNALFHPFIPFADSCRPLQTSADSCRLLQTPLFWVPKPCILLPFYYTESRNALFHPFIPFADSCRLHYFGFKNHAFCSLFTIPSHGTLYFPHLYHLQTPADPCR